MGKKDKQNAAESTPEKNTAQQPAADEAAKTAENAKADKAAEKSAEPETFLERGLAQYGDEESPHRKGLEMVFNQFKESLKKLGVETMDAAGKPFDPEKHNAVMHVEDENYGENTVVEVLQQGFTLGDKVLRFAIVKVAN